MPLRHASALAAAVLLATALQAPAADFSHGVSAHAVDRPQPAAPTLAAPQDPAASPLIANTPKGPAVQQKDGLPYDGLQLSRHNFDIRNPNILVTPDGTIHVAFVEEHRTTYKYAVYYTASTDGGATFSAPKNMSESMPNMNVGTCYLAADAQARVYLVWRTALKDTFSVETGPHNITSSNLVYRVLQNGSWNAKPLPISRPGSLQNQDDGALSCFVAAQPKGPVHVVWVATPDRFHPELMYGTSYKQHSPGIGNGLVFQSTLDGATASPQKEIHLSTLHPNPDNPSAKSSDGYDCIEGYIDPAGSPHYIAQILDYNHPSGEPYHFHLFEGEGGTRETDVFAMPGQVFSTWRSDPKLLLDAQGRQHVIYLYNFGEQPCFRDQLVGVDQEPTVIRQAAEVKGTADDFQAFQAPGGHMIVCMQMNDTGQRGEAETYVSISDGSRWSTPINVTNNAQRTTFQSKTTGALSSIASLHRTYPGPCAATLDPQGHLLLVHIAKEGSAFSGQTAGYTTLSGESTTPILRFLKL